MQGAGWCGVRGRTRSEASEQRARKVDAQVAVVDGAATIAVDEDEQGDRRVEAPSREATDGDGAGHDGEADREAVV